MGGGGESHDAKSQQQTTKVKAKYTRQEVAKHTERGDQWMIIGTSVYDISNFVSRHPGGKFISFYSGEDATEPFKAFHPQMTKVEKYLKSLHIGEVSDEGVAPIVEDFRKLRQIIADTGLMKPNRFWFAGVLAHIVAVEIFAVATMYYFGTGWLAWGAALLLIATSQAQTGWLQHDFGHLSTSESIKWNHFWHLFTICAMKGACASWWNARHFRHHAKPNVVKKDPDVNLFSVFVLGKNFAKKWGEKKRKGYLPYEYQDKYWHIVGPALLLPTFFHYDNWRFVFSRGLWLEGALMMLFNLRLYAMFSPFLGFWGFMKFYFVMRVVESHWFTWVTQMNHIPMHIDTDEQKDWVSLQTHGTCNVDPGFFNDWFTGHLNYQIEHHFFPTMPRHNYAKVAPLVKDLCKKHDVKYVTKPLWKAFVDVVSSLKEYSDVWQRAYYE